LSTWKSARYKVPGTFPGTSYKVCITLGNSADMLPHQRSDAYSVELVLLNKRQISGGGACLHCYFTL